MLLYKPGLKQAQNKYDDDHDDDDNAILTFFLKMNSYIGYNFLQRRRCRWSETDVLAFTACLSSDCTVRLRQLSEH